MTLTNTMVSIDSDKKVQIKKLGINLSEEVRIMIDSILNIQYGKVEDINIKLEKAKEKQLEYEISEKQGKLSVCRKKIEEFTKIMEEKETERLEAEKKVIEDQKKCLKCNKVIDDSIKKHNVGKGFICHTCYFNSTGEEMAQWNK